MIYLISSLADTINTSINLFLGVKLLSTAIELILLGFLVKAFFTSSFARHIRLLLIIIISCHLINDIFSIIKAVKDLYTPLLSQHSGIFLLRLTWIASIIKYFLLGLFIDHLNNSKSNILIKIFNIIATAALSLALLYLAIVHFNNIGALRPSWELLLCQVVFVTRFLVITPILVQAYISIKQRLLPSILLQQLKILTYFVAPYIVFELLSANPLGLTFGVTINYGVLSLASLVFAYFLYYSSRRMMYLRFLNETEHVRADKKFDFMNDFKGVLEQLSQVMNEYELQQITSNFFAASLSIPPEKTQLYMKRLHEHEDSLSFPEQKQKNAIEAIESFLASHADGAVADYLKTNNILIKDELEFSDFYTQQEHLKNILLLLKSLNAEVVVMLYDRNEVIGYLLVEENARPNKLYTDAERDEIVVFCRYLINIIKLLRHRNLKSLIKQEKELREELDFKNQELNHYKESLRSFVKACNEEQIGLVYTQGKKLFCINESAQEIAETHEINSDNYLFSSLQQLASKTRELKTKQTTAITTLKGKKLVATSLPAIHDNTTIIMLHYLDVPDIIKFQPQQTSDSNSWDYLLYLETTDAGRLLNELIPGSLTTIMDFKIAILKATLSKRAIIIESPKDDLPLLVDLIHNISAGKMLKTVSLNGPEKNNEVALKLFGINHLFSLENQEPALLSLLQNGGTLFIENIDYLSMETQQQLFEFITYGFFKSYRSEQKIFSKTRIVCSSKQNLQTLVLQNNFSTDLYNELEKGHIRMPSLLMLSTQELNNSIDHLVQQIITTKSVSSLITLNDKEKQRLIEQRPSSMQELKTIVHNLVCLKAAKNHVPDAIDQSPSHSIADPRVLKALKLGKHALKDKHVLELLLKTFKSQAKLAMMLGVNRSSIHRRCKEFNLV